VYVTNLSILSIWQLLDLLIGKLHCQLCKIILPVDVIEHSVKTCFDCMCSTSGVLTLLELEQLALETYTVKFCLISVLENMKN
jgi:hypothetical protein